MNIMNKQFFKEAIYYIINRIALIWSLLWLVWILIFLDHGLQVGFDTEPTNKYLIWLWFFALENGVLSYIFLILTVYVICDKFISKKT